MLIEDAGHVIAFQVLVEQRRLRTQQPIEVVDALAPEPARIGSAEALLVRAVDLRRQDSAPSSGAAPACPALRAVEVSRLPGIVLVDRSIS